MDWSDEVGKGWKHLVDPLVEQCEKEGIEIVQVKEKFGGLRFYTCTVGSKLLDEMIEKAEYESKKTCEVCGKPGKLDQRGWWKTLCEEHTRGD